MTEELKAMLEQKKNLRKYLFIRAFLLSDNNDIHLDEFPFYGNWKKEKLTDSYYAYVHNTQYIHHVDVDGRTFFLFGHAYNPFTMEIDENKILERIAEHYNTNTYWDFVDEMTGLFVYGVIDENGVHFINDPSSMQSAWCGYVQGHFYMSSHPQLIGDICHLTMSETAKEYVSYKWYPRLVGPYLPADLSQFDEVKRVVPNINYTYSNGKITHKRFYPLKDLAECKTEEEYNAVIKEAADILKNNMELVSRKWKKPAISLTGGIDSNTTFASANGIYDRFTAFSYLSAEKETIDAFAAKKIAKKFHVPHTIYKVPPTSDTLKNYDELVAIIDHNNGYIAPNAGNENRKRVYLVEHLDADVEVKSWVSETIRAYWYKYYNRKTMPELSPKLYRNLYKIFTTNRKLAHKTDKLFEQYIKDFEYEKIPKQYPTADIHYNEVTWGGHGGRAISEMKIYADITMIYDNRKFMDLMFKVPLEYRISDQHHLDMKKYLNPELYAMNIRIKNMKETNTRAFLLNTLFTINSFLP